jgi:hypothetical protein
MIPTEVQKGPRALRGERRITPGFFSGLRPFSAAWRSPFLSRCRTRLLRIREKDRSVPPALALRLPILLVYLTLCPSTSPVVTCVAAGSTLGFFLTHSAATRLDSSTPALS